MGLWLMAYGTVDRTIASDTRGSTTILTLGNLTLDSNFWIGSSCSTHSSYSADSSYSRDSGYPYESSYSIDLPTHQALVTQRL